VLEALIDVAQAQLAAILARGSNLDAQALGLIGFDAVFVAANLAAQQSLGDLWWAPIPGLAISSGIGAWVMAVTRFDLGPSPTDLYADSAGGPAEAALRQLLEELVVSQARNEMLLRVKTGRLLAALAVLLVTAVSSTLVLAIT
jgi:hypothetical protein